MQDSKDAKPDRFKLVSALIELEYISTAMQQNRQNRGGARKASLANEVKKRWKIDVEV